MRNDRTTQASQPASHVEPGPDRHSTGRHSTGRHGTDRQSTGGHATGGHATGGHATGGHATGGHGTGWRGAGREVTVAGLLVVAVTAAAWALEGPAVASFTALAYAALSLVALRALIEPHERPQSPHLSHELGPSRSFLGFWRTRSDLVDATTSLSAWDNALRPRLTNLLAARLSERHGISLTDDPEAARRVLTGGTAGAPGKTGGTARTAGRSDLWTWIDPQRQTPPDAGSRPGIPPRVLAALIDRLERL